MTYKVKTLFPCFLQASQGLQGIPLKRRRSDIRADIEEDKCIICQKDTGETVCSKKDSRDRIIKAASIRRDIVTQRLERVDLEKFVYHVSNKCYKSYTHKNDLKKLEEALLSDSMVVEHEESTHSCSECRSTRTKIKPRSPPSAVGSMAVLYEKKNALSAEILSTRVTDGNFVFVKMEGQENF